MLAVTVIVLIATTRIGNVGNIQSFGVDTNVDKIEWGNVFPNNAYEADITVTNTGGAAGILTMTTENMPTYLTLSWNAEGLSINAGETKPVKFTLTIANNAPAVAFSFDIIIRLQG